jgi:hypothetical protein
MDHSCIAAMAVVVTAAVGMAGCGEPVAEPANQAPVTTRGMPPVTLVKGDVSTLRVSSLFRDPDGDALAYTATSSSPATVAVAVAGDKVSVAGLAEGSAKVTVTASDPGGLSAALSTEVAVERRNAAPEIAKDIPDRIVRADSTLTFSLAACFSDLDDDPLAYAAKSSDEGVVAVAVERNRWLRVSGVGAGEARVTVTATDPAGASAEQAFMVTVPQQAPQPVGSIPDQIVSLDTGWSSGLDQYFFDADDDPLVYAATSSDEGVATVGVEHNRWLRVSGVGAGEARVTVTATDPAGASAEQAFMVTVPQQAPQPVGSIPDQIVSLDTGWSSGLDQYFFDADDDPLVYAATSSDEGVATVGVEHNRWLRVSGVGAGEARVTVTATDPAGASAEQAFMVTVR